MRSPFARGFLIGIALLAVLGAVLARMGWMTIAMPRLDGHGAWHLSRASGFTAFVALAVDVTLGLVMSTRIADRYLPRAHSLELHRWTSPIALALVVGHAVVLLADGWIRFDVLDVLVPFAAPYRPLAVGIGVIAAYLAFVVHLSFGFRKRLGPRTWRRLHYLSFVVFAAAAAHALLAGTDASRPWALAVVGLPSAAVVLLVALRLRGHARPAT
jgi:predicted ferric reductase